MSQMGKMLCCVYNLLCYHKHPSLKNVICITNKLGVWMANLVCWSEYNNYKVLNCNNCNNCCKKDKPSILNLHWFFETTLPKFEYKNSQTFSDLSHFNLPFLWLKVTRNFQCTKLIWVSLGLDKAFFHSSIVCSMYISKNAMKLPCEAENIHIYLYGH